MKTWKSRENAASGKTKPEARGVSNKRRGEREGGKKFEGTREKRCEEESRGAEKRDGRWIPPEKVGEA